MLLMPCRWGLVCNGKVQFFKVGDDANGKFCTPPVSADLVSRLCFILNYNARLLGFHKEKSLATNESKRIVGGFGRLANFYFILMDYLTVCFWGLSVMVVDVPTKGFEKRVDEVGAL